MKGRYIVIGNKYYIEICQEEDDAFIFLFQILSNYYKNTQGALFWYESLGVSKPLG